MHWGRAAGVWTLTSEKGPSMPPTPRRREGGALLQTKDKGELGLEPSSLVDWATLTAYMETPSRN